MNVGLAFRCFLTPFQGTALWFRDPELRRLALRPLMVGLLTYCLMLIGVLYLHDRTYLALTPAWSGIWLTMIKPFSWLLSWLLLLGVGLVAALAASFAMAGVYHEQIAELIFRRAAVAPADHPRSGSRTVEAGRIVARETVKLALIVSLSILSLILGIIPVIAPLALLFNSWLIGFEIADLASGVLGEPFRSRLRWMLGNSAAIAAIGAAFLLVGFIPFAPLLLAPGAVAGFATLLVTVDAKARAGLVPVPSGPVPVSGPSL